MSKQLTLFRKPIRLNGYFKNPSSSYEHFINKQWKERGQSFATKQNIINEARRDWKEMALKERYIYIYYIYILYIYIIYIYYIYIFYIYILYIYFIYIYIYMYIYIYIYPNQMRYTPALLLPSHFCYFFTKFCEIWHPF